MNSDKLFELIKAKISRAAVSQDPDELSDLLRELSSLHHNFGAVVAEARKDRDDAETALKVTREHVKLKALEEGMTASKADSMKIVATELEWKEYNGRSYRYELIRSYREDIQKSMDAIRSTLSYIKYDRDAARTQT